MRHPLIAATEQEIAAMDDMSMEAAAYHERTAAAWEATARRLAEERDLAVAHDRQPYPTADAYERACRALEKHRARADEAEARLAALLDHRPTPVQATTHGEAGEAGEAQTGAQGAAEQFNLDTVRCPDCGNEITGMLNEGDSFPKHKSAATPQGCHYPSAGALIAAEHFTRRRKPEWYPVPCEHGWDHCPKCDAGTTIPPTVTKAEPVAPSVDLGDDPDGDNTAASAVQGAGRDWRGEISAVLGLQTGDAPDYWADEADAIVAALGLHELEQAAADLRASRDQLGRDVNVASKTAARATQDLFDEEQEHEELALTVNEAILRITRAGFYNSEDAGEVVQMLREVLNGTSVNDTIRHKRSARWFVETVAEALGIAAPDTATPHDVIEEAGRLRELGADLTGVLHELDEIVKGWRNDLLSTRNVVERLAKLVADGGQGSTLVEQLDAWTGSYFRLRNEVLNVAGSLVAAPGLAQELRTICAADEPLRRDYLDRHRDDIVPDSGEAIEPWQPRTSS